MCKYHLDLISLHPCMPDKDSLAFNWMRQGQHGRRECIVSKTLVEGEVTHCD